MSLAERIRAIWVQSGYQTPQIVLGYSDGAYLATVDDNGDFIRFLDANSTVFTVLKSRAVIGTPDVTIGRSIYICDIVQPIMCSPATERDKFVAENIRPLLP